MKTYFEYSRAEGSDSVYVSTHGLGKSISDVYGIKDLRNKLLESNISSLSFDLYGHGKSGGKYDDFSTERLIEQYFEITEFLQKQGYEKIYLGGNCLSSLASLYVGTRAKINGIILLAPIIDIEAFVVRRLETMSQLVQDLTEIPIFWYYKKNKMINLKSEFVVDYKRNKDKYLSLGSVNPGVQIYSFMGENDELAHTDETSKILSAFENPQLTIIQNNPHQITGEVYNHVIAETIKIINTH